MLDGGRLVWPRRYAGAKRWRLWRRSQRVGRKSLGSVARGASSVGDAARGSEACSGPVVTSGCFSFGNNSVHRSHSGSGLLTFLVKAQPGSHRQFGSGRRRVSSGSARQPVRAALRPDRSLACGDPVMESIENCPSPPIQASTGSGARPYCQSSMRTPPTIWMVSRIAAQSSARATIGPGKARLRAIANRPGRAFRSRSCRFSVGQRGHGSIEERGLAAAPCPVLPHVQPKRMEKGILAGLDPLHRNKGALPGRPRKADRARKMR